MTLEKVAFCPSLPYNLLSVGRPCDNGHKATFTSMAVTVTSAAGEVVLQGRREGLEYVAPLAPRPAGHALAAGDGALWHRRLGHLPAGMFAKLPGMVIGLPGGLHVDTCMSCCRAKSTRLPFPASSTRTARVGELVHTDVASLGTPTMRGYRYYVTFHTLAHPSGGYP